MIDAAEMAFGTNEGSGTSKQVLEQSHQSQHQTNLRRRAWRRRTRQRRRRRRRSATGSDEAENKFKTIRRLSTASIDSDSDYDSDSPSIEAQKPKEQLHNQQQKSEQKDSLEVLRREKRENKLPTKPTVQLDHSTKDKPANNNNNQNHQDGNSKSNNLIDSVASKTSDHQRLAAALGATSEQHRNQSANATASSIVENNRPSIRPAANLAAQVINTTAGRGNAAQFGINSKPTNQADQQQQQQQQQQIKFILLTICLPIASCLMLSLLLCYIWTYCKKVARFKREQKRQQHKSKVSKLKDQAKNGLREINILRAASNDRRSSTTTTKHHNGSGNGKQKSVRHGAYDKRQLTINMEANELSGPDHSGSDDQSTSSGSIRSQKRLGHIASLDSSCSSSSIGGKLNPLSKFIHTTTSSSSKQDSRTSSSAPKAPKMPGFLKYSLSYDFQRSLLFVSVLEARELLAMDLCGTSDPYVKVSLIGPPADNQNETNGNKQTTNASFKTKIHKRTLNPIFSETFQFQIEYSKLIKQTLNFTVIDYDRLSKHDEIGQISLPMESVDLSQLQEEKWSELQQMNRSSSDGQLGDLCLSLRYVPTAGKLTVVVLEARKLKKMDLAGLSDPYVKLALINEQGKRLKKKKTSIKKCTLNPHYNESFSFEIPFEQVQKVQLHATVIDYDRIGTSEPIGRIILGCESTSGDTELRHWMDMLASPRRPIAQWHSLKPLTSSSSDSSIEQSSNNNNNNKSSSHDDSTDLHQSNSAKLF